MGLAVPGQVPGTGKPDIPVIIVRVGVWVTGSWVQGEAVPFRVAGTAVTL